MIKDSRYVKKKVKVCKMTNSPLRFINQIVTRRKLTIVSPAVQTPLATVAS